MTSKTEEKLFNSYAEKVLRLEQARHYGEDLSDLEQSVSSMASHLGLDESQQAFMHYDARLSVMQSDSHLLAVSDDRIDYDNEDVPEFPSVDDCDAASGVYQYNRNSGLELVHKFSEGNVTAVASVMTRIETQSREDRIRELCEARGVKPSITSGTFSKLDIVTDPIIDGVLIRDHSMIICGSEKTFKTTLAADMALSLATGTPFLTRDEWKPRQKEKVLVFSAESGDATLKETAIRIARSKGLSLDDCGDNLRWAFWVPDFSDPELLELFGYELEAIAGGVVILDPMYYMLSGDSDNNRSKFKSEFKPINELCKKYGVTVVVVDHTNKGSVQGENKNKNPHLQDMNGNGRTAFFRSWMNIKRKGEYDRNEPNKLMIQFGGSCLGVIGGTDWQLTLNETPSQEQFDEGIRDYDVREILPLSQVKKLDAEAKQISSKMKADKTEREYRSVIMDALHSKKSPYLSLTAIQNLALPDGTSLGKNKATIQCVSNMLGNDITKVDCVKRSNKFVEIDDLTPSERQAIAKGDGPRVYESYRLLIRDAFHESPSDNREAKQC